MSDPKIGKIYFTNNSNESLTDIDCRKMVGHIQRHYRGKKR